MLVCVCECVGVWGDGVMLVMIVRKAEDVTLMSVLRVCDCVDLLPRYCKRALLTRGIESYLPELYAAIYLSTHLMLQT